MLARAEAEAAPHLRRDHFVRVVALRAKEVAPLVEARLRGRLLPARRAVAGIRCPYFLN
jgi:hypothetical protein